MKPADYIELLVPLMIAVVLSVWVVTRYLGTSRQARAQLTSGEDYRALTDEYRRLSDLAITAQEHTDLRLTDISVRLDELRDRLDRMQRILNEVE
jgi:type II secretory pathway pseudopilin PulG